MVGKMKLFCLMAMVVLMVLLLGCAHREVVSAIERSIAEMNYTEKDPSSEYKIGINDVIQVYVRQDLEISQEYTVTAEGNIVIPYLGTVYVEGLTKEQVEKKLAKRLEVYIRQPEVKVGVKEYNSLFVYVIGEVKKPGKVPMQAGTLTLQEAIYSAGLPAYHAALKRVLVITPDIEKGEVRKINLKKILYKGTMQENILLKPDDIVFVPPSNIHRVAVFIDKALEPIRNFITSLAPGVGTAAAVAP